MADSEPLGEELFKPMPIEIQTGEYGTLQLRILTMNDIGTFLSSVHSNLSDREFAIQLIHNQLVTPSLAIETLTNWTDELLALVGMTWIKELGNDRGIIWDIPTDLSPLEALRKACKDYATYLFNQLRGPVESFTKAISLTIKPIFSEISNISINIPAIPSTLYTLPPIPIIPKPEILNVVITNTLSVMTDSLTNTFQSIADSISHVTQNISLPFQEIHNAIARSISISSIFDQLPDISELTTLGKQALEASASIKTSGYGFTLHLWSIKDVAYFYKASQVSLKVKHAVMTNKLTTLTKSTQFEQELYDLFTASTVLKRRWKIINKALKVHRVREYDLSIPPLLAQVEGIVTDFLVIRNTVIREKNKLYATDKNGAKKLDSNGDPIRLNGLGQVVQHSRLQNDEVLKSAADFISNQLVSDRNAILHGSVTNYGKAKLSTQTLLLLWVFAIEMSILDSRP